MATREGWSYQNVQAIIVSIAQKRHRESTAFLSDLQSIGGSRKAGDVP